MLANILFVLLILAAISRGYDDNMVTNCYKPASRRAASGRGKSVAGGWTAVTQRGGGQAAAPPGEFIDRQHRATGQLTRMRRTRQIESRGIAINRRHRPLQAAVDDQTAQVGICLGVTRRAHRVHFILWWTHGYLATP